MIVLVIYRSKKGKKKDKIDRLRFEWGKPKTESFNFYTIKKFDDVVNENEFHRLTNQTIEDIDFYRLFILIDRTTSRVGQQFLYKKLLHPNNSTNDPLHKFIELFSTDQQVREETQVVISTLSDTDAYYIPSLLQPKLLERPSWLNLLIANIFVVICLLILSFKFPVCLIFLIGPLTINMLLHYWNKNNTYQFTRSIPQLNLLIYVSKIMSKKGDVFADPSVESSISNLKSFQQKTTLINFDQSAGFQAELSQLGSYLAELLNAFFLVEVFVLFKAIAELEKNQSSILTLFNYIGKIDAAISIASLRAGSLKTCQPVFIATKKELVTTNVYHPLIDKCVNNSLSINNKGILITGSNMSGKSTFLRTLMLNSILAQTIYTCFGDKFISPIVKQFSVIRIDDNIFEGKSYYLQEVNMLGSLIAEIESSDQNLFILDEVFKGTNTIERIAAAKAVLSYLNRNNNIVVVSTHDIELTNLLKAEYELYHFTDTVVDDQLHFDHLIKPGQLKTTNAIKILELANYPSDIIDEARKNVVH